MLYVNFASDFFQPFIMVQSLTFPDFLSNLGGILGLVAGISVMSIVEIFYHILIMQKTNNKVHFFTDNTATNQTFENHALFHLMKHFVAFVKISDMHGFPYITDTKQNRWSRIFWAVLVVVSFGICIILIRDIYQQAERSPVATRIDTKLWTLDDVS